MATIRATTARSGPQRARRPPPGPRRARGAIRWDRVGRLALLAVLAVIVLLYIPPLTHWVRQSRTREEHRAELRRLDSENRRLKARVGELRRPDALEREARRLGMVRRGERAFVIQNLPGR